MEHGAGQTYSGRQPSYAGGEGKDNVVLFLNLNRTVQAANEAAYPNAKHVIIGSPKLDTYLARSVPVNDKPVVAFSFHWDCKTLPEMGSAFDEYKETIAALTRKDTLPFEVVIHAHPRGLAHQSAYWRNFSNATVLPAFSDVVNTADIYVVDNSSTLYEWAALDRPVIILNSSKYRRNVNHGLRFWDELPGVVVNKPNDLVPTIKEVIRVDKCKTVRAQSTKRIYPYQGRSAARAAAAILSLLQ
jgi:CDP-glycerol glycerophosphotransferase (TagB/SpsB family)